MRSGTTALSNILCNSDEISGFGEAHINYDRKSKLGNLLLSSLKHGAWKPNSTKLFDKILHTQYEINACPDFYKSKVIFIAREPYDSILSIRNLFSRIGSSEYGTDKVVANYYFERLERILYMSRQIPENNSLALTYDSLISNPDFELTRVSEFLCLKVPLKNEYKTREVTSERGRGDPLTAGKFTRIMTKQEYSIPKNKRNLEVPSERKDQLDDLYISFKDKVVQESISL